MFIRFLSQILKISISCLVVIQFRSTLYILPYTTKRYGDTCEKKDQYNNRRNIACSTSRRSKAKESKPIQTDREQTERTMLKKA
jgi:hypothetical protein